MSRLRLEGLPVFLHIYDVTQEPGIRRINKVDLFSTIPTT